MITVSAPDTTYSVPQRQSVEIQLFDNKPSDYILRYQYSQAFSLSKLSFDSFTTTLIDVKTGRIIGSYDYQQKHGWGKKSAEKVLEDMAEKMRENR